MIIILGLIVFGIVVFLVSKNWKRTVQVMSGRGLFEVYNFIFTKNTFKRLPLVAGAFPNGSFPPNELLGKNSPHQDKWARVALAEMSEVNAEDGLRSQERTKQMDVRDNIIFEFYSFFVSRQNPNPPRPDQIHIPHITVLDWRSFSNSRIFDKVGSSEVIKTL